MAAKQHSNSRNSKPPRKAGRRLMATPALIARHDPPSIGHPDPAAVMLKGAILAQARGLLSDMNMGALSVVDLAVSASCTTDKREAGAYMNAIENIAKVICRKCDVIAAVLGEPRFGNFEDEFVPLTPGRASMLEQEKAVA